MKKIRLLNILSIIFTLLLITSCSLASSEFSIKLINDTIYWDSVENAEKYYVYSNDEELGSTTETEYSLKDLVDGEYTITVKYFIDGTLSDPSNEIIYKAGSFKVDTPTITNNKNKIIWNRIHNATYYEIYIDNELVDSVTNNEYEISTSKTTCTIKVRAVGIYHNENVYSDFSNEVIYTYQEITENTVTIFSMNDTHGAFETDESTPGIAKVATIIKNLEKNDTVIKIANGDIFQGGYVSNITYGECLIDVLNSLEFDCFVIGNHEFDWGIETIAKYKDGDLSNGEANFPFLAANIIDKRTNSRPEWLDEYTIVEKNNQKIGIIGLIGENLTSSINASKVENYEFSDPLPIIKRLVPKLRTEGCDFVVVSIHEYSDSTNNQISYLDENMLPDAIICAHTHQKIAETLTTKTNYDLPVLQSNTKNITVGTVNLSKSCGVLNKATIKHYYPSDYSENELVLEIVNKYQSIIDEGNEIIGFTPEFLSKSKLGYFACDAFKAGTGADIAIMNTGGVRATISSGQIRLKDIYEVFPFDNYIYMVDISGSKLKNLLSRSGDYLYWDTTFDETNIDSSRTYKLAVIDYVYFGGYYDYCFEPRNGISTGEIIRKYIVEELRKTL